jgi:glucose dehydrogenase
MDMGMDQTLANGDFEKWAEPAAGIIADSMEYDGYWYYTYVYPMTINPVSVPETGSGIDNHEISRMYAYPNPCTNTLYITNENAERIELYNANGKLLEAVENHDTQVTLNMQQYPAGLYLLKVGNDVQKILKK